jgi:hypothetical protein
LNLSPRGLAIVLRARAPTLNTRAAMLTRGPNPLESLTADCYRKDLGYRNKALDSTTLQERPGTHVAYSYWLNNKFQPRKTLLPPHAASYSTCRWGWG